VVVLLVSNLMDYQVVIIIDSLLYGSSIAVVMFVMSLGCPMGTRKQLMD
jgi:hypothetical protein